jgi:ubiquinone/menaquinone biosynthesis C-methylase UbiE
MPGRLSFDRVAAVYDETRGLSPRAMSRVLGVLVDELRGKRVLEVGVGTGRYAVPLQKSGIRVVGVDISRDMVGLGFAKGLRDIVFADGARLPFVPRAFDVAMTNHVLHLISNWTDVLEEIARVTRDTLFSVIEQSESPSIHSSTTPSYGRQGSSGDIPGFTSATFPVS